MNFVKKAISAVLVGAVLVSNIFIGTTAFAAETTYTPMGNTQTFSANVQLEMGQAKNMNNYYSFTAPSTGYYIATVSTTPAYRDNNGNVVSTPTENRLDSAKVMVYEDKEKNKLVGGVSNYIEYTSDYKLDENNELVPVDSYRPDIITLKLDEGKEYYIAAYAEAYGYTLENNQIVWDTNSYATQATLSIAPTDWKCEYYQQEVEKEYTKIDDTVVKQEVSEPPYAVVEYVGSAADAVAPNDVNGVPVEKVTGTENKMITSLTLSASVKSVSGFSDLEKLSTVNLNDGLEEISSYAFCRTPITEITIPDKTTVIGTSAFHSCEKLTTVKGGSGITDIGSSAFSYTALSNFEMPNNLNSIGSHAFESADIKTAIMPETLTELGQEAFSFCGKLEKVEIPQSITAIPKKCFYRCVNLKDVAFSDNLKEIELQAFDNCSNLTSVKLPDTLKRIENEAFFNSGLTDVTIPASVEIIGNDAFWGNDLTHASIDAKNIRTRAFANNRELKSVEFGANVETIGAYAFDWNRKLDNVDVPENVTTIGAYAFLDNPSMKKITVRNDNCHFGKNCIDISATIVCNKTSSAAEYAEKNGNDRSCMDEHILSSKLVKATTANAGYAITACDECDHVEEKTEIPAVATVKLSATKYTYNGKVQTPSVTVKDRKGETISASNYTVTYQRGRKNVGKYTVTVNFKGNYSGTVKKTFTIKPQATSVSELTAKSKGFIANWKKQATQTTGYEVQYSTTSNFKNAKTVTVSKNSTTSKRISNLRAKKKYCVRIRTYKTVNGEKIYSSWSKYKSVTTKK